MNKILALALLAVLMLCSVQAIPSKFLQKRQSGLSGKIDLTETAKELIDAFLDGAEVDKMISNSTTCLHNIEHGYDDILEAISHFTKRGWSWENYLDMTGALGDVTGIVRVCFNVTDETITQAREHFTRFDSFVDFAMQAKDNVVVHLFDWYDVYTKLSEAIEKGRDKDVAFQVGRSSRLFLEFTPNMPSELIHGGAVDLPDLRPLEEFLNGFLNGTQILSSDKIQRCVNETEFMVASIEDANAQFNKGTDDGFREGIFEIADMFEHLRPLNEQCYTGINDVRAILEKYIKTFKSPLDIALNAARHFTEIYADVLGSIQHFHNEEWRLMGKDVGDIVFSVFFSQ